MTRRMHGAAAVAYRAVITTVYPGRDRAPQTRYVGPFGRTNEARAAITKARRDARRLAWSYPEVVRSPIVTGVVERSSLVWEVVE